ncbi:MAG: hypothetical protein ABIQ57_05290 [Candidatus Kapaibacterium sp.]
MVETGQRKNDAIDHHCRINALDNIQRAMLRLHATGSHKHRYWSSNTSGGQQVSIIGRRDAELPIPRYRKHGNAMAIIEQFTYEKFSVGTANYPKLRKATNNGSTCWHELS